eukprot:CAMPEP_0174257556 /NCGR_PEP_ID=MMETSP0439-20130205/6676_1 /TAXON_ID=0 /ORGANISM="Stereomyxa ramosa, Strain Chinc5" /LENGTH=48 /DNA_ID= /DNA_START= /DNA_END= /DNA_ORIENTATION=
MVQKSGNDPIGDSLCRQWGGALELVNPKELELLRKVDQDLEEPTSSST